MTVVASKLSKQPRLPELFSGCRGTFVVIVVSLSSDPCTIDGAMLIRENSKNLVRVGRELAIRASNYDQNALHLSCSLGLASN